jgi:hypothetical protein
MSVYAALPGPKQDVGIVADDFVFEEVPDAEDNLHNFIIQAPCSRAKRFLHSLVASSRITYTPWHSSTSEDNGVY